MTFELKEVDQVEVLTLQDNFIDIAAGDGTPIVQRASSEDGRGNRVSILAEHGFCALLRLTAEGQRREALFDFGFSDAGAFNNARTLGVDLDAVEALVLSHGHMDHHGGMRPFIEQIGRRGVELVLHPAAFRQSRYIRRSDQHRLNLPSPDRDLLESAGVKIVESPGPRLLLGGGLLFLGEIPRRTDFEKGLPGARYEEGGAEKFDSVEDDSALVAHLKGKGLVVLSGCAHSGIVNTVAHARELTGVREVFAMMGGFHLTGVDFEPIIAPTVAAIKEINPRHIIPTHCTGRRAAMQIEREMPDQFLLNMSGTRMVFAA